MITSKVLLVDDEVDFSAALAERLKTRGIKVDIVDNGDAAIKFAQETYYDAIILDMAMPGMDGMETLKGLLNVNPDYQIVFLTGKATLEKAVLAVKLGALDFLEKPVKIDALMEKIEEAKNKKIALTAKREKEKINNILKKKGW